MGEPRSSLPRWIGLSALKKQWGTFEPPGPNIEKKAAPEPVNDTAKALGFGDYAKARRLHYAGHKEAKDALNSRIRWTGAWPSWGALDRSDDR